MRKDDLGTDDEGGAGDPAVEGSARGSCADVAGRMPASDPPRRGLPKEVRERMVRLQLEPAGESLPVASRSAWPSHGALRDLSHDLRAPFVAIDAHLALVAATCGPDLAKRLSDVRRACAHGLALLDGLDAAQAIEAQRARDAFDADDPAAAGVAPESRWTCATRRAPALLPVSTTDLRELVADVAALASADAAARAIGLEVEVGTEVPRAVEVDAAALRRALANLVVNAVKFTDAGRVRIEVRVGPAAGGPRSRGDAASVAGWDAGSDASSDASLDASPDASRIESPCGRVRAARASGCGGRCGRACGDASAGRCPRARRARSTPARDHATGGRTIAIAVLDEGPGLDPAVIPVVFDPIARAAAGCGSPRAGRGLGLSIAARAARALGGTISAANRGEGGAVFTLSFPIADASSEVEPLNAPRVACPPVPAGTSPSATAQSRSAGAAAPLRALIVDDSEPAAALLEHHLAAQGASVRRARTLREAREALAEAAFDLVVSDVELPDGSGLELADELADELRRSQAFADSTSPARPVAEVAAGGGAAVTLDFNSPLDGRRDLGFGVDSGTASVSDARSVPHDAPHDGPRVEPRWAARPDRSTDPSVVDSMPRSDAARVDPGRASVPRVVLSSAASLGPESAARHEFLRKPVRHESVRALLDAA